MKHESTIGYKHFPDDLADIYPFSIEEAVLAETIANPLDARAGITDLRINSQENTIEIRDDGRGMNEREFENYHNFSKQLLPQIAGPGNDMPVIIKQRTTKFGPKIGFVSDESRREIAWAGGSEKVFINKAHPACRAAEKTGQSTYHCVAAVGFWLIRDLSVEADKVPILNKYLANWGGTQQRFLS